MKMPPNRANAANLIRISAVLGLLILGAYEVRVEGQEGHADPANSSSETFFETYCYDCHGPETTEANLNLRLLPNPARAESDWKQWTHIADQVRSGHMPPADHDQPSTAQRRTLVRTINDQLSQYLLAQPSTPRTSVSRRLTNFEYENTMRDLLGIDLKLIDDLPKDPVRPYRFNNTTEFMRLGPEQIDRYLATARRAMASAIVDPQTPEVHRTRSEWKPSGIDRGMGTDEVGVWGNRRHSPAWGVNLKSFPRTGEYRIRIKASAILPAGVHEVPLRLVMGYGGLNENQSTYQIEPVGTLRLKNSPDQPRVFEFRGRIENHPIRPSKTVKQKRLPESMAITPQNLYDDGTLNDDNDFSRTRNITFPRAVIEWIEFEAPVVDSWPPDHHRQILFESELRQSDPDAYVRQVLLRFMDRAYRRPATDTEVNRFVEIFELVSNQTSSLEEALRETLAMVLISPQFLYHTTASETTNAQEALASRLSYFLWGSMPDPTLRQLAASGQLDNPEVMRQQVQRLLADPRANDFLRNFTLQWLSLEKLKTVPINRELFPRFLYYVPRGERAGTEEPYRPTIRDYMVEETVGFVGELVRSNSTILELVDSDFAWLNQPLAAHYGVAGVEGNHFRRIPLPAGSRLGGLLTHGSILVGNGTGSAPHPIYRAVWLREAILGYDVPPPPADVPALTDSVGESAEKALTIKDLLRQHRQQESCRNCHASLDPWGIPFEQYNAIGRFQPRVPAEGTRVNGFSTAQHGDQEGYQAYLDSINSVPVGASTQVPGGPQINGLDSLKRYLLKDRQADIVENMVRRLLTYALGRPLELSDQVLVRQLIRDAEAHQLRMQDVIVAICQSKTFMGTD